MILQELRWVPPTPTRVFRWDGTSFPELEAMVNGSPAEDWAITPIGSAGSVRLQGPIGGEDFTLDKGDYFYFNGEVYPIGPDAPGLPYPSDWLD